MRVEVVRGLVKMEVSNTELNIVRGIPHCWFSEKSKAWHAPLTPWVVNYLSKVVRPEQQELLDRGVGQFRRHPLPDSFAFKTKPYPHQLEALERSQNLDAFAYFMEPGLGKSKVIVDDASFAFMWATIEAQAVVCPNSIKSNWVDEIEIHSPLGVDIFVYAPERKEQVQAWIDAPADGRMKWFVIAVESLSSGSGRDYLEAFLRRQRSGLAVDESSRIKTWNALRTQALHKMAPLSVRRRIATGTPITKSLLDAWAQYEFLSPEILCSNYFAFRRFYCLMENPQTKVMLGGNHKVAQASRMVGSKNEDHFFDLTAHWTILARKADCLDLPEKVYQVRHVTPNEAMRKAYQRMLRTGAVDDAEGYASALNALVRRLRLQQITGGFLAVEQLQEDAVTDVDELFAALERGETPEFITVAEKARCIPLEGTNPKIEELLDIINETPGKMIIFCRFRPEIDAIQAALTKLGEGEVVVFHGDCSDDERTSARRRFQNDPHVRFIVLQESTGGIGITLTAAQTVVYFSNSWSLEDRIQSEDRAHRIGQTGTVVYIDLIMDIPQAVDACVHAALKAGRSYTDELMDQLKETTRRV